MAAWQHGINSKDLLPLSLKACLLIHRTLSILSTKLKMAGYLEIWQIELCPPWSMPYWYHNPSSSFFVIMGPPRNACHLLFNLLPNIKGQTTNVYTYYWILTRIAWTGTFLRFVIIAETNHRWIIEEFWYGLDFTSLLIFLVAGFFRTNFSSQLSWGQATINAVCWQIHFWNT